MVVSIALYGRAHSDSLRRADLAAPIVSSKRVAAPVLHEPTLSGGTVDLARMRGRPVVINFFASWCDPCKREAPVLEQLWQQDKGDGLVVLGIDSNDSRGDARKFLNVHGVTYPVVFDHNGRVASNSYAVANLPVTYVLNPQGRIVGGQILGPVSEDTHSKALFRYVHAAMKS